ncbi:hypothetical protein Tco_0738785 [Tanacetum coccineum]
MSTSTRHVDEAFGFQVVGRLCRGDEGGGNGDGGGGAAIEAAMAVVVAACGDGGVGVEREAAVGGQKLAGEGGAAQEKVREHVYSIKYLLGQSTKDTIVQTARNPSAAGIVFSVDLFIIGLQLNHVPMSLPGIIIPFANDLKANMLGPSGELDGTPTLPDGQDTTKTVETKLVYTHNL